LAASLSASNIYFWNSSGYFTAGSESQPLLHTWSLAVEEQFYLVFPVFLMFGQRMFKEKLRLGIVLLFVLSLLLSSVEATRGQSAGFYLLHSRAWELLLGTIVAMGMLPPVRDGVPSEILSTAGLLMILGSVFAFSNETPFPGLAALLPSGGAALVIHTGLTARTVVSRLLSQPLFVFVGLISYSLYLWHWPLIVFQKTGSILFLGLSGPVGKSILICAAFVPAILSWWLIEEPFRRGRLVLEKNQLFAATAGVTMVISLIAVSGWLWEGFPNRFSPAEIKVASYLSYDQARDYRQGVCFVVDEVDQLNESCLNSVDGHKNYLLIGDSFAADLWRGLTVVFPNINFMQATGSGCRPTLAQAASIDPRQRRCANLMNRVFSDFLSNNKVDALLIAGAWRGDEVDSIMATLKWANAKGFKTILFGPKIQYDTALPRILVSALRAGNQSLPDEHRPAIFQQLDHLMSIRASALNVEYISFFDLLCKGNVCRHTDDDGGPLSFDMGHLTKSGSTYVAERLREMLGLRPDY
jgi:hypothetical protein